MLTQSVSGLFAWPDYIPGSEKWIDTELLPTEGESYRDVYEFRLEDL